MEGVVKFHPHSCHSSYQIPIFLTDPNKCFLLLWVFRPPAVFPTKSHLSQAFSISSSLLSVLLVSVCELSSLGLVAFTVTFLLTFGVLSSATLSSSSTSLALVFAFDASPAVATPLPPAAARGAASSGRRGSSTSSVDKGSIAAASRAAFHRSCLRWYEGPL